MYNEVKNLQTPNERPAHFSIADSMIKEILMHPLDIQIEMLHHIKSYISSEWNAMIENKEKDLAYSKECYSKLSTL